MFRIESIEFTDTRVGNDYLYNNLSYVLMLPDIVPDYFNAYYPEKLILTLNGKGFGDAIRDKKDNILGNVQLRLQPMKWSNNDNVIWWSNDYISNLHSGPVTVPITQVPRERRCRLFPAGSDTRYYSLTEYNDKFMSDICVIQEWSNERIVCSFRASLHHYMQEGIR